MHRQLDVSTATPTAQTQTNITHTHTAAQNNKVQYYINMHINTKTSWRGS